MINLFLCFSLLLIGNSDGTITKLQNKFESIKYLQADFKQSSKEGKSISGKFYFSKKNNYRIELGNNVIISDGESIWNEDSKRKKVVISRIDEDPLAFSLSEYIYDYPAKCKISEEKVDNGYLINLDASNTDLNFKTARLWINENYLITKISVIDFGGNEFLLNFNNIVIDRVLESDLFIYKIDNSKKIIDIR